MPDTDPVAALVAQFEALCRERGYWISIDGRVSEDVAAELLDRAAGTLRNWRANAGTSVPFFRHRGRVTYRLHDLAKHLEAGRVEEQE